MSPTEKKAFKWREYNEIAKPQLLELINYCQDEGRVCPEPGAWNRLYRLLSVGADKGKFTKYPPIKPPLILGGWCAEDVDKRKRFLTQIYWFNRTFF